MREPVIWLAAALYEATRRGLPYLCRTIGCREVRWLAWDAVPNAGKQEFIKFATGILEGVTGFLEEEGNAITGSEKEREQESETPNNG